ncbi:putative Ig domain-containing protein [Dactylosporangium fulvum]|uniref:Ig domain-containing protein n=1 Tax=Dactylosporangium fulvum TaxID=53359 RepID=A0ABY5VN91_9ACTN|nr:putative Ig domain-containing protein [Dactylosporangium fulvum]UWP79133.1 putative Ig domain-containing protein [Dactylosporangium fulvum]
MRVAIALVALAPATIATPAMADGHRSRPKPPRVAEMTPDTLTDATEGVPYMQQLTSTAMPPVTFSITAGSLPTGMLLSPWGMLSGIPTATGSFNFTVFANSPFPLSVESKPYTLEVLSPAPTVTTTTLADATQGEPFTATVSATGGSTPYSWSLSSAAPPAWLMFDPATGVLSGTPPTSGTFTFTVQVTDANSATDTQVLTLTVNPSPLGITTTTAPGAVRGAAYSTTLAATGGVTPYTWSVHAGTLPAGLTLNPATGAISGTPTTAGTSNFTVEVADAASGTDTQALTITVGAAPLSITTTTLVAGKAGTAYSASLAATGGVAPYTWAVHAGNLPAGLTLNPATGAISGTPTAVGDSTFTVRVTDDDAVTDDQELSLQVAASTTPPQAPASVQAVAGTSAITVSWPASVASVSAPVTGYTARATPGPATCSTKVGDPAPLTCVLGAVAGVTYTVTVVADSDSGPSAASAPSNQVTVSAPQPPATVPATDLTLTTDQGDTATAAPGASIVVAGTGFAPYSTAKLAVYSAPQELKTVTTDGSGNFSTSVTVPSTLTSGKHTVVALGAAPDGSIRVMKLIITVTAGDTLAVTGDNITSLCASALMSIIIGMALLRLGRARRGRFTALLPTGAAHNF